MISCKPIKKLIQRIEKEDNSTIVSYRSRIIKAHNNLNIHKLNIINKSSMTDNFFTRYKFRKCYEYNNNNNALL